MLQNSAQKSHNPESIFSLLRGLEMVQIQKTLKEEFGGGTKEFTVKEVREPLERKSDKIGPYCLCLRALLVTL